MGVPVAGVLDGALLRTGVHVGEAEALSVAFGPLEIVQETPVMVRTGTLCNMAPPRAPR